MRIERIEVTPRMAEYFLSKNYDKQRKIDRHWVETIANDIKEGRWNPNIPNSALVFSKRGDMLDGQHRCLAISKAQVPVRTYAIYDADESAFRDIDNGISRKAKDFMDCKNANVVCAVATFGVCITEGAKLVDAIDGIIKRSTEDKVTVRLKPSKEQVLSFYDKNEDSLQQIVSYATSVYSSSKIFSQGVFAKTMWLIDYVEGEDSYAPLFFDDIKETIPNAIATGRLVRKFHEMTRAKQTKGTSYFRQRDQIAFVLAAYDKFKECKDFTMADVKKASGIWSNKIAIARMNSERLEVAQ